jgi:hypothetical protein
MMSSSDTTAQARQELRSRKHTRSTEPDVNSDSIHEAEENIAKLQTALDDAQQMLQAAERAHEAAQHAHEAAEGHAATLRTASILAIAVIVVAVLLGFRRRRP